MSDPASPPPRGVPATFGHRALQDRMNAECLAATVVEGRKSVKGPEQRGRPGSPNLSTARKKRTERLVNSGGLTRAPS